MEVPQRLRWGDGRVALPGICHCMGRHVEDDEDNMPRGGPMGPHAHGNEARHVARHVVDDPDAEGRGATGRILPVDMAHTHTSLAPAHRGAQENCGGTRTTQQDEMRGPVRAHGRQVTPVRRKREAAALRQQQPQNDPHTNQPRCSGRQNAATRRSTQSEERVTVQGPVKKQQPDGMPHRGGCTSCALIRGSGLGGCGRVRTLILGGSAVWLCAHPAHSLEREAAGP